CQYASSSGLCVSKYRLYAAAGSVLCSTAKKSGIRLISMNRSRFPVHSGCDDETARGRRNRAECTDARVCEQGHVRASQSIVRRYARWQSPGFRRGFVTNETSAGAEETVAGVAESGQDVSALVQLAVQCGAQNRNVWVGIVHASDTGRRRDEAEKTNTHRTRLLERI